MKKLIKHLSSLFACSVLLWGTCFPAAAEVKASEGSASVLTYQADSLSWNGEEITVKGTFTNSSTDKDITQIDSATLIIQDADGVQVFETTLNSSSLGDVKLAPGETWNYTVIRTISGFNPDNYDLADSFRAGCTSDISISSHKSGCSFCRSRGNLTFSSEDTMSQEEWNALLAKLQQAVKDGNGSASSGSGGTYVPDFYTTDTYHSADMKTCTKCGGAGYLFCTKCNGIGYKERQEKGFCLVNHHADCPSLGTNGAIKCNDCHERHDYHTVRDSCHWCGGDGRIDCSKCFGRGVAY